MKPPEVKGNLELLLLAVVRSAPAHGYTIIKELSRRTQGGFNLSHGAVYPALKRLEEQGLLASSWKGVDGRRRRVYRITKAGSKALGEQTQEWEMFARNVKAVLEST